jgi:hypothetical protein
LFLSPIKKSGIASSTFNHLTMRTPLVHQRLQSVSQRKYDSFSDTILEDGADLTENEGRSFPERGCCRVSLSPAALSWKNDGHSRKNDRPHCSVMGAFMALFLAIVITVVGVVLILPTEEERALLDRYDLSFFSLRNLRMAQASARFAWIDHHLGPNPTGEDKNLPISTVDHQDKKSHELQEGCEATVLLVRHCEKGFVREHCAYIGYERSVYLASQFGHGNERWPLPSHIFAEAPGGRHHRKANFREVETVGPLAAKAGVVVDSSYIDQTKNRLARHVWHMLEEGQLCGRVVVVAWKHSSIAHLARQWGCGPSEGCPLDYSGKSFDTAWQIKFVYRKFDHSTRHSLQLPHFPEWKVFGSVVSEGFDPLAASKRFGDYPSQGTQTSARWMTQEVAFPERKSDRQSWVKMKASRPIELLSTSREDMEERIEEEPAGKYHHEDAS